MRHVIWILLSAVALAGRATAATGFFEAGAYVIDMGQPTQTIGNALKPYGLIYDLVTNYDVPVNWAINPAKTTFRLDAGDAIPVDFTATITTGTKSYSGGSFIIDAAFLTPAVIADIDTLKAQGVVVDTLAAPLTTEIYGQVTGFPHTVLDAQNADLAVPYYTNAEVPDSAYQIGLPTDLDQCDDVFILTPADPDSWPVEYVDALYNFVNDGGGLWAGSHSVGELENLFGSTPTQLNFLSNGGLYGDHTDGTPPYSYNSAAANDPIMQIMNRLDAATQNGSEQIYVPNSLNWRSTTTVAVFDPDHPDNPVNGTTPFNDAAVIAYGNAFGDPTKGLVMYEGGDSLAGNAAANIAAQRAFLNFLLTEGIIKAPQPAVTVPTIVAGQPATLTATISGGSGSYSYQWVSSSGGVFSTPAGTWNVGDPPITTQYVMTCATDMIRLLVTDTCGRQGLYSTNLADTTTVVNVSIANVDDAAEPATNGKFRLTLSCGISLTATNISYSVTGTATSGSDYAALTGTVLVPAGAATADIDMVVLDDGTVEAAETVGIQLISSDNPHIGIDVLDDTATVQISDDDTVAATTTSTTSTSTTSTTTPMPAETLLAIDDSFLRTVLSDRNEGANEILVVGSSVDRRTLVKFDLSDVTPGNVRTATLVFSIRKSTRWGKQGRSIDVAPLLTDFVQGNGKTLDVRRGRATRGTGAGVTWHCPIDSEIGNKRVDCTVPWNGAAFGPTSDSVLVRNGQTGEIAFDVTADVRAGTSRWLVKLSDERRGGRIDFLSREGATAAGTPDRSPRIVIEIEATATSSTTTTSMSTPPPPEDGGGCSSAVRSSPGACVAGCQVSAS